MTLKELQKMIKEEMTSYVNEEEDEFAVATDMDAPEIDVDVDAGDIDVDGSEVDLSSDDILRTIYDQLAAYFDPEGGEVEDFEDETLPAEEPEGDFEDGAEDDDVEETYQEGDRGLNERRKNKRAVLRESKQLKSRFQKLANIVKG